MKKQRPPYIYHLCIIVFVWFFWAAFMWKTNQWSLFYDNWFMSATMVVGSFIAGGTSEGGGAVAFPVMTLIFGITPQIARDFSLMIQSIGMSAAALFIVVTRTPMEWRAIKYTSLGGIVGITAGFLLMPMLPSPSYIKIFFTSLWLSFAVALYLVNRQDQREVVSQISNFQSKDALNLCIVGVFGGVVSGITGSGIDIITFSLLTLHYQINEKVATPTSVVLMAVNSCFGFFLNGFVFTNISPEAWNYWLVCIPVVVVGAPLGAWFIKQKSRVFITRFLYCSISAQFIGALYIIPLSVGLVSFCGFVVLLGTITCIQMSRR
ncbi:sulfite exporter TauE/SafE family protein [Candidatus Uabimicrobium amorphum]|uniref:Probable membrane transporter protein n=1 Tax=Uabimicrobium amorphum TaxID=2596890 RepID=A0A5S9IHX8_UABAM|nr:sulfite exporter TauE/SafE family protein [Candidatus Uabimicrobium amorphum]BBM82138.1 hypothetical protein UABAM_00481 [Candidatus Uabimicrobium amorphum]